MQKNKKPRRSYDNYPTPLPLAKRGVELAMRYVKPHLFARRRTWKVCELGCGDTQPFLQAARMVLEEKEQYRVCYTGVDIRTVQPVCSPGLCGINLSTFQIMQSDIASFHVEKRFDLIVMNPPFMHAVDFATAALQHIREDGVVAMIGRQSFYTWAKDRDAFWRQYPPTHVSVISPRPSFSGDGKTDGCEYVYYLWAPWMGEGQTTMDRIFWEKPKRQ